MADKKFRGRQFTIYLPTANYLEIWKQRAKAANCSLNQYIFEKVESEEKVPALKPDTDELNRLRAEVQRLQTELEGIRRRDADFFKLPQPGDTFSPMPFKQALINALREGGYWTTAKINSKFRMYIEGAGANPGKIIDELATLGLIRETLRGWVWVKK